MERMLIKHLSGSKANQVEEFALKHHNELIFGRESPSTVKYDPDRDDLVGRQHAKITRDPNDPEGFLIEDLNSRNGTFLNKQRGSGKTKVHPGDYVQLGPGGPEFQFEVEPRPANATKATRIAETAAFGKPSPETRVVNTNVSGGGGMSNSMPTAPMDTAKPPGTVGKATVERMISHTVTETKKSQGRKFGVIGGAYYYNSKQQAAREQKEQEMKDQLAAQQQDAASKQAEIEKKMADDKANAAVDPSAITEKYGNTVVKIDVTWHLIDAGKNTQLYHQYVPNDMRVLAAILKVAPPKEPTKIISNAGNSIPVYLTVGSGQYEPLLTNQSQTSGIDNPAIGGHIYGSGFIVTGDGTILTNRHVGASWMTVYEFNPNMTPPGIVINPDGTLAANSAVPPPTHWVPSQTKQGGRQYSGTVDGVNDNLVVGFNGKEQKINAQFVAKSPRHDVAVLKIPLSEPANKVEINDNYETLKRGEQVTIMGYPMASPDVYGIIKSKDPFNNEQDILQIPQVTVTTTNISNILRGSDKPGEDQTVSIFGDVIQLATNTTGHGNSGGPVFDSHGRVIGIFFAGSTVAGTSVTYAVPIRFGMEMIHPTQ